MWVRIPTRRAIRAVAYCGISGFMGYAATQRKISHRGMLLPPNRRLPFITTERLSFPAFSKEGTVYKEWHRSFMPLPSVYMSPLKKASSSSERGYIAALIFLLLIEHFTIGRLAFNYFESQAFIKSKCSTWILSIDAQSSFRHSLFF